MRQVVSLFLAHLPLERPRRLVATKGIALPPDDAQQSASAEIEDRKPINPIALATSATPTTADQGQGMHQVAAMAEPRTVQVTQRSVRHLRRSWTGFDTLRMTFSSGGKPPKIPRKSARLLSTSARV